MHDACIMWPWHCNNGGNNNNNNGAATMMKIYSSSGREAEVRLIMLQTACIMAA